MYSVNGAFGEVRLAHHVSKKENPPYFFLSRVGWHKCNDLYSVNRPKGGSYLIIATVGGCGSMCVAGKSYDLPVGSIALIPRNTAHSYRTPAGGSWEFYWMHPKGELADRFLDSVAKEGVLLSQSADNFAPLIENLLSLSLNDSQDNDIAISHAISDVLHLVAKNLLSPRSAPSLSDEAIKYIKKHYGEKISISDIAGSLFISENHLIRVFKKDVGVTPHKYLNDYRILTSAYFLRSSALSIREISESVGFSSTSLFITSFKRVYGCTPNEYKKASSSKAAFT